MNPADFTFLNPGDQGFIPNPEFQPPPQPNLNAQHTLLKKYLSNNDADDSDNESDTDSDDPKTVVYIHYYSIAILVILAIVLYLVYKMHNNLNGLYEAS